MQLISIDLIVAMPILSLTILALVAGLYVIPRSYMGLESAYARKLSLYSDSQLIISSMAASGAGYFSDSKLSSGIAEAYGANALILPMGGMTQCLPYSVCRIVYIKGRPYVLEVKP